MKIKVLLFATAVAISIGCTRKQTESSTMSVPLPPRVAKSNKANTVAMKSLAADDLFLTHAVINVTGEGITPIILNWDKRNSGTTGNSFNVTVSKGTTPLVQVLAVYQSPLNDAMTFYYGDVAKTMSNADETVEVIIKTIGGDSIGGRITGRYLTGADSGPSGDVVMKYVPGDSKPKMIIERTPIFNGWFSIFSLTIEGSVGKFEYAIGNELLFGEPVTLSSPMFLPAGDPDRRIRAAVPVHLRNESHSGTANWLREEPQIYVWGYWGNASAKADAQWLTRSLCRSSLTGSLTRLKKFSTTVANWPSQPALTLSVGSAFPLTSGLTNITTPLGSMIINGGKSNCSEGTQPAADKYTKWLSVTAAQVDGNGNDSVGGFRGPFKIGAYNSWMTVSSADPRVLTADVLPGVATAVDQFRLFKKVGVGTDYYYEDADCNALKDGRDGYVNAGTGTIDGSGRLTLTSNISSTEATTGTAAVLCPLKDSKFYTAGMFISSSMFLYGSGSGGPVASDIVLEVPTYNSTKNYSTGVCVPMRLLGRDGSNNEASIPSGTNATLTVTDPGENLFYSDAMCTTAISGALALAGPSHSFFMRSNLTGTNNATITATMTGTLPKVATATVVIVDSPATPVYKLLVRGPTSIMAHKCYAADFETWHDNGSDPAVLVTTSASLSFGGANLSFYNGMYGPGCTSSTGSSIMVGSSNGPRATMWFRYTGASSTTGIQPTSGWGGTIVGGSGITVTQPGPISALYMNMSPTVPEGMCVPIQFEFQDANGNPSPVATTTDINLSSSVAGSMTYGYSGCGSNVSYVTVSGGTTAIQAYFKRTAMGAMTLTASVASPALSATSNITVTSPIASTLVVVLPGQTLTGGAATGIPTPWLVGESQNIVVYALNYNGTNDTSYTGYRMTNLSGSNLSFPAANTVNFDADGKATIAVTASAATTYASISVQGTQTNSSIYGSSGSFTVDPPATKFKIFMNYASALLPGACQLFSVVPQDNYGKAGLGNAVTVDIAVTNGTIYTDGGCTTTAATNFSWNPSDRLKVFFYKNTTPTASGTITTTATGFTADTVNYYVNPSGTVGSVYKWQLIGHASPDYTVADRCMPYVAYQADSAGMFVLPGSDFTTMQMAMGSLSGTTGAFWPNPDCTGGPLDGSNLTLTSATGFYIINASAPSWTNGGQQLNISGSPLQSYNIQLYRNN